MEREHAAAPPDLRTLLETWEQRTAGAWRETPERYLMLGQRALELGHPTLACEILREALRESAADPELRYLAALAHAKIGGYREAAALVTTLIADRQASAKLHLDAQALAGRIAKDRWARQPAGPERDAFAAAAFAHYRAAWEATRDPFPGVNAATLAVLTGDAAGGAAVAREVRTLCLAPGCAMEAHWREATLGEVAVLLGEHEVASHHYAAAVVAAGRSVGHVAAMRRQLRLISASRPVPPAVFAALAEPRVVVFTGHMLDEVGRATPRFPAALEATVAKAIAEKLDALEAGFGYCSAACGADLLFIEAMLVRGAEVHVTLPFERADFVATSVAFAGPEWVARFEKALSQASSVHHGVRERFLGDEALFAYANALMQGAAVLRARQLEGEATQLAVLDSNADLRAGGTHETVAAWDKLGLANEVIDLGALRATLPASAAPRGNAAERKVAVRSAALRREVKTMLFADVVGFSKLTEEDTPAFLLNFLGGIAEIIARSAHKPEFVNTWGDGLFMVFGAVEAGAEFALQLRDEVVRTDWPTRGLPAGTSIRIGMHAGPVFPAPDPIILRTNFFGSHVNRAARIEPVTAPGAVYVSEPVACLLAASGVERYAADFLGTLPLAKGFGSSALYRLRRADEIE